MAGKVVIPLGIILTLVVALSWSMVGVLVTLAKPMVDPSIISFSRFFVGTLVLLVYMKCAKIPIKLVLNNKWIWIGAIGKAANYLLENIGLANGSSYGNMLVMPIMSTLAILMSAFYLREKVGRIQWIAVLLCLMGVCFVSWNGLAFSEFLSLNSINTLFFVLSGIGAAFHLLSSRQLVDTLDGGNLNASTFSISAVLTLLAMPVVHTLPIEGFFWFKPPFMPVALLALIGLGCISGISFLIYNKALKMVPFMVSAILVNTCVLWQILWSKLFFASDQPISVWAIIGAVVLLIGIVLLNVAPKTKLENGVEQGQET